MKGPCCTRAVLQSCKPKRTSTSKYLSSVQNQFKCDCNEDDNASFISLLIVIISNVWKAKCLLILSLLKSLFIIKVTGMFFRSWISEIKNTKCKSSLLIKSSILIFEAVTLVFILHILAKALFIPIISLQIGALIELSSLLPFIKSDSTTCPVGLALVDGKCQNVQKITHKGNHFKSENIEISIKPRIISGSTNNHNPVDADDIMIMIEESSNEKDPLSNAKYN